MEDLSKIANAFKLWQFSLFGSFCLLSLGFTGDIPFSQESLNAGQENMAIFVGVVFFIATCVLKYLPPPEARGRKKDENGGTISYAQKALCTQIAEWTSFDDASDMYTSDHDLEEDALKRKNTELRIELGKKQGLLMSKDEGGINFVKYRYTDDRTRVVTK